MATTQIHNSASTTSSGFASPVSQLKLAAGGTVLFGLMIAFGAHASTDGTLRWFLDIVVPSAAGTQPFTDEAQLLAAILGGVMAGWAVMLWMLVDALAADQPRVLQRIIYTVMAVWFVIDCTGSFAAGAWPNVIGNIGFLALFIVPASRLK